MNTKMCPQPHSSYVVHIHHKINLFLVSTGASLFTLTMVQIGLLKKMLQERLWKKETPESFLFSPKSLKTEVCLLLKCHQFSSQICQPCLIHTKKSMRRLPLLCPPPTSLLWRGEEKKKKKNLCLTEGNNYWESPMAFTDALVLSPGFPLCHRKIH